MSEELVFSFTRDTAASFFKRIVKDSPQARILESVLDSVENVLQEEIQNVPIYDDKTGLLRKGDIPNVSFRLY